MHSVRFEKLLKAQRIFCQIYLVLQLLIEELQIDVGVLNNAIGGIRYHNDVNTITQLVKEQVHELKDEGWLDRHNDFGVLR